VLKHNLRERHFGKPNTAPKSAARFTYFAAGAGGKSVNVSTPVRQTSPRDDVGQTPKPPAAD